MIQVIIPTYNRPKCIELLLKNCIGKYKGDKFKFVVLDSSTNEETKMVLKNVQNLEYRRFDPSILLDDKVIGAILGCQEEYYWLLGDGNLVDFNMMDYWISQFSDFDVLEVDLLSSKRSRIRTQDNYEIHNDLMKFIKERYSHLTYWGATIVRTEKAKFLFINGMMKKYREDNPSWWAGSLIAEMIANDIRNGNKSTVISLFTDAVSYNPGKTDHSWTNGENYFRMTFQVFDKDVYLLPKDYDGIKDEIIRVFRDDAMVTKRKLLHLKRLGVIKPEYVRKYKTYIQDVKGYYGFILMLSFVPDYVIENAYKVVCQIKRLRK